MNEYERALMPAPSLLPGWCITCGRPYPERHHAVPRSQGGADGPELHLCGQGNTSGCHGEAHSKRLHFRYRGGWEYLRTEPTRYETALAQSKGWERCR